MVAVIAGTANRPPLAGAGYAADAGLLLAACTAPDTAPAPAPDAQ